MPAAEAELFIKRNASDEWLTITQAFNKISPAKFANVPISPGDRIKISSPAGGGWGPPEERDPAMVREDLLDGFITPEQANPSYGLKALVGPVASSSSGSATQRQAMTVIPNSMHARDIAYLLHPNTNARRHEKTGPIVIDRGEGIYVYDDQGNEYIEAHGGVCGAWA